MRANVFGYDPVSNEGSKAGLGSRVLKTKEAVIFLKSFNLNIFYEDGAAWVMGLKTDGSF